MDTDGRRLLDLISPADLVDFESRATVRRYEAETVLFHEADPSDWVFGIRSGRVKISVLTEGGREAVLAICEPGELLGELAAVDGEPRSATATAMEPVEGLLLPVQEFRAFLLDRPTASLVLLGSIARRLRAADRHRLEFNQMDTGRRVATRLVELAERFGATTADGIQIELPITQTELAGWSGCSVEATTKALTALRRAELIVTARRSITILDPPRLRARAAGV